eukprot:TRINITY_DN7788_c0_g1_i1.p1 TRINITY_DN7788_c0_g1~~TRINITY_DN7788_c0_g1_i1.p1  ORF type:complete len:159 (+),score=37.80 TRINITY_DN7788_c0_g1_i1:32-508(+)
MFRNQGFERVLNRKDDFSPNNSNEQVRKTIPRKIFVNQTSLLVDLFEILAPFVADVRAQSELFIPSEGIFCSQLRNERKMSHEWRGVNVATVQKSFGKQVTIWNKERAPNQDLIKQLLFKAEELVKQRGLTLSNLSNVNVHYDGLSQLRLAPVWIIGN